MNVIFLDLEGTLICYHDIVSGEIMITERVIKRIALLPIIQKMFDIKYVIESACKDAIDEETMQIAPGNKLCNELFSLFDEYGIECIGRTPNVSIKLNNFSYTDVWKEFEIMKWLYRHPEVDHYCVVDDNDTKNLLRWKRWDLQKIEHHLVETSYYNEDDPELEGLQLEHIEQIGEVLKKENEIQKERIRITIIIYKLCMI